MSRPRDTSQESAQRFAALRDGTATKRCSKCRVDKPVSEFYRQASHCKTCLKAGVRKAERARREAAAAAGRCREVPCPRPVVGGGLCEIHRAAAAARAKRRGDRLRARWRGPLHPTIVRAIRISLTAGGRAGRRPSQAELAKRYGVSQQTVSRIATGKTYRPRKRR